MSAPKKILLAEDELLVAKVLKMILEKNNYEVRHEIDEQSTVNNAGAFEPDLIILDVYLKNKTSGIEAGRTIRKSGIESPIVLTTGNSFEQTTNEIKEISNSYLFIKPIEIEQLMAFIKEKLG
jgi:DNA-binding response OmpR family regulator